MKNGKLTIFMIAVVAIGVFSLPAVMSVGLGQHTISSKSGVACEKCHAGTGDGVYTELAASGNTELNTMGTGMGIKIHSGIAFQGAGKQCSNCHDLTAPTGDGIAHTGITQKPVCTTCHTNVQTEIVGTSEPHSGLAPSISGNLGCLGCHSAVRVSGSPSYTYSAGQLAVGLFIGNGTDRNLPPVAPLPDPAP